MNHNCKVSRSYRINESKVCDYCLALDKSCKCFTISSKKKVLSICQECEDNYNKRFPRTIFGTLDSFYKYNCEKILSKY
jgi:hypothetical protein